MIAMPRFGSHYTREPQPFGVHRLFHHISGLLLSINFAVVSNDGRIEKINRIISRVVQMKKFLLPPWRRIFAG